jgi:multiple sugar transport system substrate-binding protein
MARVDSDPLKQKAAWSAAAHLGGKDISLWCATYPSASNPIATATSTSRNG